MTRARDLVALLRPTHWTKNAFVLAGPFFAGELLRLGALRSALLAFVAFCLVSSAVYAFNDIMDREADRRHPRKCRRPVASGAVSVPQAAILSFASGLAGMLLAARAGLPLLALIALYVLINLAYSRWLKHAVLVDVFCIAAGFLLRLLAGTWGIGIPPSRWFVLCTFLLSLFLGFSKRYAERMDATQESANKRSVVEEYSPEFLRALLAITLSCTLMSYGLYTVSPATVAAHGTSELLYTLPFAALALFRYLFLVLQRGYGENLAGEVLRDRWLLASLVLYFAFTGFILGT